MPGGGCGLSAAAFCLCLFLYLVLTPSRPLPQLRPVVTWVSTVTISALKDARLVGAGGLLAAPLSQLSFSPVFFAKKIAHGPYRNRERRLSGHDATGMTRPYRNLLLAKNVESISNVRMDDKGVF